MSAERNTYALGSTQKDMRTRPHPVVHLLPALIFGGFLALLLLRLTYVGQAQSFDGLIYSRSLWGIAHGALENPVYDGVHTWAIHGSFLTVGLAPLTFILKSPDVLIAAQVVAFVALIYLVARSTSEVLGPLGRWWAPLLGALVAALGSPLILNAFLFDVRPDVLGIPLMTAGLLRAERRRGYDGACVIWFAAAVLMREEYAAVAAGALALAPWRGLGEGGWRLRGRFVAATAFAGYLVLYWFGIRGWLGGETGFARAGAAMTSMTVDAGDGVWGSRLEVALAFIGSVGLLHWRGWRWLGATLPGLGILLVITRMHEDLLSFHYVQFIAPGLVVAGIAGLRVDVARFRVQGHSTSRLVFWVVGGVAAVLASFFLASAAPGGGRFQSAHFDLPPGEMLRLFTFEGSDPNVIAVRTLIDETPDGIGVAAPYMVAGQLADRQQIWTIGRLRAHLQQGESVPDDIEQVILLRRDWTSVGQRLVALHGFTVAETRAGIAARLVRSAEASPDWQQLGALVDAQCDAPIGRWPSAGLVLCAVERLEDGRLSVVVRRQTSSPAQGRGALGLMVQTLEGQGHAFLVLDGLLNLVTLPDGAATRLNTQQVVSGTVGREGNLVLFDAAVAPVPAVAGDGSPVSRLYVRW